MSGGNLCRKKEDVILPGKDRHGGKRVQTIKRKGKGSVAEPGKAFTGTCFPAVQQL